jgi:ankyrin repeat protein
VQKRLDKFLKELQLGLREGSVITSQSSEVASADEDESIWDQIGKELEDVGITTQDFAANKDFIISWIKKAIEDGQFKELAAARGSRALSVLTASTDARLDHIKIGNPVIVRTIAATIETDNEPSSGDTEKEVYVKSKEPVPKVLPRPPPIVKPPARLISRKTRFINRVTRPLSNYDRELTQAAIDNKVDHVRALLKYADPTTFYKGSTAFNRAIEHSSTGVLQIFLENGVPVDHEAQPGETALIVATRLMKVAVVEIFAKYGSDVNLQARNGATALIVAAQKQRDDIIGLLLGHGAKPNLSDKLGRTALHIAASKNDLRSVSLLLEAGADINFPDDQGKTALILAASAGHNQICSKLLSRGANPSILDTAGLTALAQAARYGRLETCKELLGKDQETESNGSANDTSDNVDSPFKGSMELPQLDIALLLAAKIEQGKARTLASQRPICRLLLQRGANINSGSGRQNTALHEAASSNSLPLVQMFLAKGANINSVNDKKQTPLHLAARNGQTSTLHVLVQRGANINCLDIDGSTALHHAVLSRSPETVRALVELGLDLGLNIEQRDKKGVTALVLAEDQRCHPNILRVLQGRPWVDEDNGK